MTQLSGLHSIRNLAISHGLPAMPGPSGLSIYLKQQGHREAHVTQGPHKQGPS